MIINIILSQVLFLVLFEIIGPFEIDAAMFVALGGIAILSPIGQVVLHDEFVGIYVFAL